MNLGGERVEPLLPNGRRRAQLAQVRFELGQRSELGAILALAAVGALAQQARRAEHAQVTADGGAAHGKGASDGASGRRVGAEHQQDLAPDRVGKGSSNLVHAQCVTRLLRIV
jgi:hypothetical protein